MEFSLKTFAGCLVILQSIMFICYFKIIRYKIMNNIIKNLFISIFENIFNLTE